MTTDPFPLATPDSCSTDPELRARIGAVRVPVEALGREQARRGNS